MPRKLQLTVVGIVLCLLAALFAVESKIAWFGPNGGTAAQISASKLQASPAPRLVMQALAETLQTQHFPQSATVVLLLLMLGATRFLPRPAEGRAVCVPSSNFSPQLFFRPPPAR